MGTFKGSSVLLCAGAFLFAAGGSSARAAEPDDFAHRCAAYQDLRAKAAKGLPKRPKDSTPEQMKGYGDLLRSRLIELRADAKPGDVLTPAVFEVIAAVRSETAGKQGKVARDTVLGEGNPDKEGIRVPLKINARYDAPLSTVPPDLLARLPELPENLQFRFVGKNLILYDSEAEMVVDYISGAVK
jgi:hypothetical protein